MNTLTVNLHLLMATFYRPSAERNRIVIEDAAFPSDSHAVASQVRHHGHDPASAVVRLRPRAGEAALRTEDILGELERLRGSVALVLLGGVNYLTGELARHPGRDRGRARHRRRRRLGSRARGRQRAARPARVGCRLGGVVPLQVRQRGPGRAGRRVRPRASRARPLAAAPRGLVGQRPRDALPHGAGLRAAQRRGRVAGLDALGARVRPVARVARALRRRRHARRCASARCVSPATSSRCSTSSRRSAGADPDAARPGAPRLPALAGRSPRRGRSRLRCGPSTASSATCASPT